MEHLKAMLLPTLFKPSDLNTVGKEKWGGKEYIFII
jgi:hypothetical protein